MPDNNNFNPWSAAAGGAFVGGAGYSFLKNRTMFQEAWNMGNVDIIGQTVSQVKNLTGFNSLKTNVPGADIFQESLQASISGLESKMGLKESIANIHAATYRSIMSGGQTTHREALGGLSSLYQQSSALGAYRAGLSSIKKFQGDVGIFQQQMQGLATVQGNMGSPSQGGFGLTKRTTFKDIGVLSEGARAHALRIQQKVQDVGGNLEWGYQNIEDVIGGQKKTTPMMIGSIGGSQQVAIPLGKTGVTYGGPNLSTRYLTRQAYTAGGQRMTYNEMYEQSMIQAISASNSKAQMKTNLLKMNQSIIDQMNMRDSSSRSAAIWTSPFMTSGSLARARLTTQEAVAFGAIKEEDILGMLGQGVYPYTSPSAAGAGTLATRNLSEELFGPLGKFMSASDRPTQFVRQEWGVTGAAKQQMSGFRGIFGQSYSRLDRKIKGPMYESFMYGKGKTALSPEDYSAPQLLTFYAKPANKGFGLGYQSPALNQMLAAEEGVISKSAAGMMEYERIVQKKITLDKGFMTNPALASALKGVEIGRPVPVDLGLKEGFIGIEKGTGKEILTQAGKAKLTAVGAELTGPNEALVYMRERRKLNENEMWKFFSEENKFMASAADDRKMRQVAKAAGLGESLSVAGQPIEAIFSGKLVGRNKMALLNQQIEATSMFLGSKIDRGQIPLSSQAMEFLDNPTKYLNVQGLLSSGAERADLEIQKNLMGLAKQWDFSQREMQLTFGLTPEKDFGTLVSAGVLRPKEAYGIMQSPGVVGLGKGRLGDLATGGGAGKIASFEQTGFRALAMKGAIGQRFAAELSKRLVGKGELGPADIMAGTVLGQETLFQRMARKDATIAPFTSGELIQEQGRYVSLGKKIKAFGGSDVMYIPGALEAPGLVGSTISKGKRIEAPLTQKLSGFREVLSAFEKDAASLEQVEAAAAGFRNTVVQQAEAQAAARGKVLGSRFLTGQRKTFAKHADVFRIAESTGLGMFEELISRASTEEQAAFLAQQKEAFKTGEIMTGGMWRHPTTGPESFQFVRYMKDKDVVSGMVAAPTQFGKINFQDGRVLPVDVSHMVGFKGDFDRDQFALSLISDRHTSDKARRAIGRELQEDYTKYLFNHYAMKDLMEGTKIGSAVTDWSSSAGLQEGYRKLSTAKTATGSVNLALQKLKLGTMYGAAEQYRPMAEMFYHLEEAAIGGKHGVVGTDVYKAISESVETGGTAGARKLETAIKAIMGEEPRTIRGAVTDALGQVTQHELKYDPRRWSEAAMSSYDAMGQEIEASMRSMSTAKGKTVNNLTLQQATEMYHGRRTGSVDVAQAVMQENASNFDSFTMKASRTVQRGQGKIRSIFSALNKAKGPILAGMGLAAGIMLAAPTTAGVLRNPESANAGRNLDADYMVPPGSEGMHVPQPGMNMSPKVYDMGSGKSVSRANIRMRTNDLDASSGDFMRSARQLSEGGSVNIRTRDDRSILDPRSLANKIHERL
jgi:hypothetical protein